MIYQINTVEGQKNLDNLNVSSIDFGECENVLEEEYKISHNNSILIIKVDTINEDINSTFVQYELYHPYNKTQLDLGYCSNLEIYIKIPVNLSDKIITLS